MSIIKKTKDNKIALQDPITTKENQNLFSINEAFKNIERQKSKKKTTKKSKPKPAKKKREESTSEDDYEEKMT